MSIITLSTRAAGQGYLCNPRERSSKQTIPVVLLRRSQTPGGRDSYLADSAVYSIVLDTMRPSSVRANIIMANLPTSSV